ncbi:hypothetical protein ACQ4PT_016119 [Festuca glaucescens]
MARWWVYGVLSLLAVAAAAAEGNAEPLIRLPTQKGKDAAAAPAPASAAAAEEEGVTRWAVLVAGSNGYKLLCSSHGETHNLKKETIKDQYDVVKNRTSSSDKVNKGSHVMEYGDKTFKDEKLFLYQGFDPANVNKTNKLLLPSLEGAINQRDADILFMWKRYEQLNGGSEKKLRVLREIKETVVHRKHLDSSVDFIGKLLFGFDNGPSMLEAPRSSGQPVVDDWDCLKRMVRVFESHCGSLTQYGMKHMRAFANICNNGFSEAKMKEASISACSGYTSAKWSPLVLGHSA